MKEIKYDYINGPATVQWIPRDVLVGKIRCHVDENVMPGPTRYSALIEVEPTGEYEMTMLNKSSDAMKGPTLSEHSGVRQWLESLGFKGLWRRVDNTGAVKVVANVRGNVAQIKKEEVKMDNCNFNLSGTLVTVNGVKKADYAVNLYDLDQAGVAVVQNKVLVDGIANSLGALATEYGTQPAAA